jgi:hypothetical protein
MSTPGYTAEASVYRTSNAYHAAYGTLTGNASAVVMPQQLMTSTFGFLGRGLCVLGCLALGCVPFCTERRLATGGDAALCALQCAVSPSGTCALLCSGGDSGGTPPPPPPSRPPVCSVEDCPPVGPLRCCGGFSCVNGRCVPPPGTSPF